MTSPSPYADSSNSVSPLPLLPKSDRHRPTTTSSRTKYVLWRRHTLKQLKLVIPGAALTYYLGTIHAFLNVLHGGGGFWARAGAIASSGLGLITISLFSYVLFLPWLTGQEPDYKIWRGSGVFSVIPALRNSIVIGWLLAVSTLGQWSSLGYVKSVIGVSAFYALTFGLLGLVPTRRISFWKKL